MLTASLNDHMPAWLTVDNAEWIGLVLLMIAAALGVISYLGRNTHWDKPARDLATVTPAEAQHWNTPRRAPVIRSGATDGYVCAAPARELPDGICGWPAGGDGCPEHGELLDPDTAYEPTGTTHSDYRAGGAW